MIKWLIAGVCLASVLTAGVESQIQMQAQANVGQAVQRSKVTETAYTKRTPSATFTATVGAVRATPTPTNTPSK